MLALAVAILYALHSGRSLCVDWRDRAYGTWNENLFPQLFTLIGVKSVEVIPQSADVAPACWCGRLHACLDDVRAEDLERGGVIWSGPAPPWDREVALARYSIDASKLDHPNEVVVMWSSGSLPGLLKTLKERGRIDGKTTPEHIYRQVLRENVKVDALVRERIVEYTTNHFSGNRVVGVHCRRTEEAARSRLLASDWAYFVAVNSILKGADDAVVFLATDNEGVEQAFVGRYGAARVLRTEKWLPDQGESIHMNANCPDSVRAAVDALIDIYILAGCQHLVLSGGSSFSYIASWLSPLPADRIKYVWPKREYPLTRILSRLWRGVYDLTAGTALPGRHG